MCLLSIQLYVATLVVKKLVPLKGNSWGRTLSLWPLEEALRRSEQVRYHNCKNAIRLRFSTADGKNNGMGQDAGIRMALGPLLDSSVVMDWLWSEDSRDWFSESTIRSPELLRNERSSRLWITALAYASIIVINIFSTALLCFALAFALVSATKLEGRKNGPKVFQSRPK